MSTADTFWLGFAVGAVGWSTVLFLRWFVRHEVARQINRERSR